jgi:hypothetical protein
MSTPHTSNPAPAAAAMSGKRPIELTRAAIGSCSVPAVHLGDAADWASQPAEASA